MTDPSDEVTVVVDTREPTKVAAALLEHPDVDGFAEEHLDAADIVVNGVGFERKTPADFASSILEGRIDEQVEKLTDAYEYAYVLLEGSFPDFDSLGHTQLKGVSARGKAASITARHGISVIPTGETPSLVDMATRLGRKHTEDPTSAHLPTGAIGSDEPPGKRMWACLPKVGPTRAEDLYAAFGGPVKFGQEFRGDDAINALLDVDGIGPDTARTVSAALRGETDV